MCKPRLRLLLLVLLLASLCSPLLSAQDTIQVSKHRLQSILNSIQILRTQQENLIYELLSLKDSLAKSEQELTASTEEIKRLQDLITNREGNLIILSEQLANQETLYKQLSKSYQASLTANKFLGWGFGIAGFLAMVEAFFLWLSYNR